MTRKQKKVLYRICITVLLLVVLHFIPVMGYWSLALYMIPYLIIGYDILRKAGLGIIHGSIFDENFLMAIATIGAIILGEYVEGTAVMLFYQIGELFQSVAVGKSRRSIAKLMDIRPDYANVEEDGKLVKYHPQEIAIGTVITVLPGEKIPLDGRIVEGQSTLNTSALTGESLPCDCAFGDMVISGSVNLTGCLKICTTKEFAESTVTKILDLVENASMKKSRSENFITKFSKYYTPAVCAGALALAVLPPVYLLLVGGVPNWSEWLIRALTFLVISCPCALVISIPLSFFGGIGGASAQGILIKGSNYLEALAQTKYIVFDKTGTLTKGNFQVSHIMPVEDGLSPQELLEYAAYAESFSNHPISISLKEAYGRSIENNRVQLKEELGGHGIIAIVDNHLVAAGNDKLMKQQGITVPQDMENGTIVYIALDQKYAGCIIIEDQIKEQAKDAISGLKTAGIKQTIMLTGDRKTAADRVATQLGIDMVKSELLPQDKVTWVEELLKAKKPGEKLGFVGDGINDAPVLSRADIGIAMGALGSDAAIEAADIVLMDDNPKKIVMAISISKKCLRIVYENIVFALSVKGVCLLLGATGKANMWMAIFADVGVMVLAVLNAIRCLRTKKED